MAEQARPTRDDLLVMAYVDDELADEQRKSLEDRLEHEPELARQVASYRKLAVLAEQVAPPEPLDREWERLRAEPSHRAGVGLGWTLLLSGLAVGVIGLAIWVLASDLQFWAKFTCLVPSAGFLILLWLRWRDRQRLLPFDPYTEVKR